ncbi:restriction endonuclease [Paenibacillus polymyxa]|uniref:restriction endonuclease n=1 Tax=Paenibacillus polymyxa TaxID=1406 RepID=UPI002023FC84|nr:restriction endonuclease [Paenibacillus polymyxa]URJ45208.1 restriction endonuclease [Paenibacillus polymyxa]
MEIDPTIFRYFDGVYFEQLVMEIFGQYGYHVKSTKITGDQGVDLIMIKENKKVAVQCKRYKNNVNNKAVQEAFAGMHFYNCDHSMVVTSSTFTKGARQLANALQVELIDCNDLKRLISANENNIGRFFFKSTQLTQILINSGYDLLMHGQYQEAIKLLNDIIAEQDNLLEENKDDLMNAYNYLAKAYKNSGDFTKAEETYIEGLSIERTMNLLNNLAVIYRDKGLYTQSKNYLMR